MQRFFSKTSAARLSRVVTSLAVIAVGITSPTQAAAPADSPADPSPEVQKPTTLKAKAKLKKAWSQIGKASWYGGHFQGRTTANGEQFDMNSLTCAHRSLPLGSWARITNLRTKKSVFVRVNDRGPLLEDRVVDLSYAAARALGIAGLGRVRIDPVNASNPEQVRQLVNQTGLAQPVLMASR